MLLSESMQNQWFHYLVFSVSKQDKHPLIASSAFCDSNIVEYLLSIPFLLSRWS